MPVRPFMLAALLALGPTPLALAQSIAPLAGNDPAAEAATPLALSVSGAVQPLPGLSGFRHEWPGVSASARFEGEALIARFDDPAGRYRISVDGGPGQEVTRPGRQAFRIAALVPGPHTVTLAKLSETAGAFAGFAVPPGGRALPPPPPRARQIEVIGDSDSVGYGIASAGRDCDPEMVFAATDTERTFGPQVARAFDADLRLVARSGIGMVRNHGGSPEPAMNQAYATAPVAADWHPQLVIIALGSNDFAGGLAPGEAWESPRALRDSYQTALAGFLAMLRTRYPDALLLMVRFEDYGGDYADATEAAVAERRRVGDAAVDMASFPELARTACHWHPSLDDHAAMAAVLTAYVETRPDIWHGR